MVSTFKIMMIDDDRLAHILHKEMIAEAGLNLDYIEEFLESTDALNVLKERYKSKDFEKWPDVILIDLNMPKLGGWDFIAELEAINLGEYLPSVYLVTNSENPKDIEKANASKVVVEIKQKFLDETFFKSLV